jgi:hypothetical protein
MAISNTVQPDDVSSTHYDAAFQRIDALTWLPWVGGRVPTLPKNERLLIVGESHYSNETNPSQVEAHVASLIADRHYTRDVIQECPVNQEWWNPTLENIGRFLLCGQPANRTSLWSELSFYNFVQRPMEYALRKERPTWEDWVDGWKVFQAVVEVLKPTHCIFIGVASSNSFDWAMNNGGNSFVPVERVRKVRRTWARSAQLQLAEHTVDISFMRHCGAHFSWSEWHEFLKSRCFDILVALEQRHTEANITRGV